MPGLSVSLHSVPRLRRGVRRLFDAERNIPMLMAPERVVLLDDIADAIIAQCSGGNKVSEIIAFLASRYNVPGTEISADVVELLEELVETSLVSV